MCVHRSTDYGHTWTGPYEVTAATNPNNYVDQYGDPLDAADKEFIDVDPATGRVVITWTNFTPFAPGGAEIRSAYSDDGGLTWSAGTVLGSQVVDGTGSMPAFSGDGKAYAVWSQYEASFNGYGQNIGYSRSTDNGKTWGPETSLTTDFFTMDQVLGNDRVHCFPAIAVDTSSSPYKGDVYVVYANNNNRDGADVAFQRSRDGGLTFSKPVLLDARPGNDRAQWFPTVAVDKTTGRVSVFYFDQGVAKSGDLMQTTVVYSDDGGKTWTPPSPLSSRPYHAAGAMTRASRTWATTTGRPQRAANCSRRSQSPSPSPLPMDREQSRHFQFTTPDVTVTKTSVPSLPVALDVTSIHTAFVTQGGSTYYTVSLPLFIM